MLARNGIDVHLLSLLLAVAAAKGMAGSQAKYSCLQWRQTGRSLFAVIAIFPLKTRAEWAICFIYFEVEFEYNKAKRIADFQWYSPISYGKCCCCSKADVASCHGIYLSATLPHPHFEVTPPTIPWRIPHLAESMLLDQLLPLTDEQLDIQLRNIPSHWWRRLLQGASNQSWTAGPSSWAVYRVAKGFWAGSFADGGFRVALQAMGHKGVFQAPFLWAAGLGLTFLLDTEEPNDPNICLNSASDEYSLNGIQWLWDVWRARWTVDLAATSHIKGNKERVQCISLF